MTFNIMIQEVPRFSDFCEMQLGSYFLPIQSQDGANTCLQGTMWQMTTRNSVHQWENCRSEKTKDRDHSLSRISYFEEQIEIEWRMMKNNGISSWAMRARIVIVGFTGNF